MVDLSNEKLELNYPSSWIYKIVILETSNAKKITKEVFGERIHNTKSSKTSKKGKFKSFTIDMIVHNEDDRIALYELLGKHKHIKMVL
jgi:putative lipoic acid-binding regulatory protein